MVYPYVSATPYLDGRYAPYPQNNAQQYYPQQTMQTAERQEPGMICRPVASIEEAKAIPTDFNGNLMVLPDVSHGMIHTKQLNYQDGSAIFKTYSFTPQVEEATQKAEFAPMSAVESLKMEIVQLKEQFQQVCAVPEKTKPTTRGGSEKG